MQKRLLAIVFLTIVLAIAGCDSGTTLFEKNEGTGVTRLEILRSVRKASDSGLLVLAKEITFDYNKRTIVVGGLINITGDDSWVKGYEWIVPEISIQDNKLIVRIPEDTAYHIYIGKNYHYLPVIAKEK